MLDGSIRKEFRPPEEVFAPAALESFKGAALTIGHPDKVTPTTYARDNVGFVDTPERTKLHDGQEYAVATVDVNRVDALTRVDSGELEELSAGYTCEFDPTPGKDPVTGDSYDGVQRNIRANHVALLPPGKARAGRLARLHVDAKDNDPDALRLDADGNQLIDIPEQASRMKFLLNGKEFEAGPELQVALTSLEAEAKTQKDRADKAEGEAAKAAAKADTAEAARKDAVDKFDAAVASEIDFRSAVAPILDSKDAAGAVTRFDFAGKSRRDVQLAVVKKLRPAKEFAKDASDLTVGAYFDALVEDWKPEGGSAEPKKGESYTPPPKKDSVESKTDESLYTDEAQWAAHLASLHLKKA